MYIDVYDVGGTWTRGALAEFGKRRKFLSICKERTEKDFCGQLGHLMIKVREDTIPEYTAILVPGPVESNSILRKSPPLEIKYPINLRRRLEGFCKHLLVENDMNGALEAELCEGYGKKYRNFYLLTFSTGIGAGVVCNGIPKKGNSGEVGHIVLEGHSDVKCGCGNNGCWGAFCSGNGIENLAQRMMKTQMSCEEVFTEAERGRTSAKDLIEIVQEYNAQGIGTMLNVLDTDAIIVMGSIGIQQFNKIIPARNKIKKYTINPIPIITPTLLGDNIGLIGAYHLAAKKVRRKLYGE